MLLPKRELKSENVATRVTPTTLEDIRDIKKKYNLSLSYIIEVGILAIRNELEKEG